MRIGPYQLTNNLALAPMAGVTDLPFRRLCRAMGAGLAAGEMLSSDVRLWHTEKSKRRMDHGDETEPRVVQIVGGDADMLAEAARRNADAGAQIIDVNMGCPAKKVCNKAAGSALLKDEALVEKLLQAVVGAVDIPITLKIRTGWHPEHRNGVRIAKIAQDCGIQALAVHGRTRACMFEGEAEYETIRAIKHAVQIPIFANGDIDSPQKAQRVLQETGADGVMIGRAAQGRPWLFKEIAVFLSSGKVCPPPSNAEVRDMMRAHLRGLYEFYGEATGVRIARKHIGWYAADRPQATAFRHIVMQAVTAASQLSAVENFFESLDKAENAADNDKRRAHGAEEENQSSQRADA